MRTLSVQSLRPKNGEKYALVFGLAYLSMIVVLIPLLFMDRGYFLYYGDFNSQQLPFYYHANDVVHSGGLLGWDWQTDLGSSFIGSYAFYLAGSPFFWLSCILPKSVVLYAIPWLLALKHAVAATTAYAFIRRFVQNKNAAVIGGLLYAFSGFQIYNIFFNHFQDVTAFFPLLLIAMEELVNNNRRGWFAAAVALMAIINYFFFTGQVVFVILYFFVRVNCKDFRVDMKKLAALAIEAVLGVCIAAVVLAPAAMAILANSRVSQMLFGQDMVVYGEKTRIVRIIQSFFMIPDAPARPNLFDSGSAKWASIGGYLPLFSMAGVITFMKQKKRHWATRLTGICIICAMVPFLNSAFYMFNGSYYARWFYMPILIMALMTAYALDDKSMKWRTGVMASLIALVIFLVISLLPTKNKEDVTEYFKFAANFPYFLIVLGVTLLCWLGLYYLFSRRRDGRPILRTAVWLTTAACIACTATIVYFGKSIAKEGSEYLEHSLDSAKEITVSYETDEDDYFRVDISKNRDNYPMFWGLSNMRCFQSVVNPSIMEFYDSIGITRDVASRAETTSYTLRGLFSVKYYFDEIKDNMKELDIPGFVLDREEGRYKIYRNAYFIPMGFTYDHYVTKEEIEDEKKETKERLLIEALVLDDEQAARYADILTPLETKPSTKEEYLTACEKHQEEACTDFTYDSRGFAAKIALEQPKLVFFSVPFESGWSATVNGSPVDIENVSNGFMAIRCEAGENEIVFSYEVPGLRYGFYLTVLGIVLLILYLLLSKPLFSARYGTQSHSYDYTPVSGVRAAQAYATYLSNACKTEEAPPAEPEAPAEQEAEEKKEEDADGSSEREDA